jgi:hypothetical protein
MVTVGVSQSKAALSKKNETLSEKILKKKTELGGEVVQVVEQC